MLFDDTYQTIKEPAEGKFSDRGSKFLAFAYPVSTEAELKERLSGLKKHHPKANHCCWALRLGTDRSVFRINDDGEPAGTAGRPVLNILLSRNLTNVAVIVIRYFGGTLLGVPGLINAYKAAAEDALKQAAIIEKLINDIYMVTFEYSEMNNVIQVIKGLNVIILRQDLQNVCTVEAAVRQSMINQFINTLSKIAGVKYSYLRTV